MDEIIQLAKKHTLEAGKHPPTVFVQGTRKKGVMLLESGDTAEKRQCEMFFAGRSISGEKSLGRLQLVCLVSEGCIATPHNGKFIQPSKDPERIEVLLFNCLEVGENKQTFEVLRMVRNPDGKLTDLWTVTMPKGVEVQSYLLSAFMSGYMSTSSGVKL